MVKHFYSSYSKRREHFIQKYLIILGDQDSRKEKKVFKDFVHTYLRDDGVFLLRSVGNNSSEIILMDLIKTLWTNFKKENMKLTDGNGNAPAPAGMVDNKHTNETEA